jgi:hypothetical protein
MSNNIEEIATEEEKQLAASYAIDAYDKEGTYFAELELLVNRRLEQQTYE